ncbi:hypothetical protein L3X38_037831 [Prunus dulcis]|uniref:Uncharacterized protein n=1 Tax=Prunus dulcis TaxID=3755 RepID=A0AAD4V4G7_PRUDU|nr:hypothetical protein L3X38_037831 [Prunus dulcis]
MQSNIPEACEQHFQGAYRQDHGVLHRRNAGQSHPMSRSHQESCRTIQPAPKRPHEVEPEQVHNWSLIWPIFGFLSHPKRHRSTSESNQGILYVKWLATTKEIQSLTGRAATLN